MRQLELGEAGPLPNTDVIGVDVILRQPTRLAALKLCVQHSGLSDKEICGELGIDKSQWSRILSGLAYLPTEKYHQLMDICGNEIPLIWDAAKRGYELKRRLSAIERENFELRQRLRDAERDLEVVKRFIQQ